MKKVKLADVPGYKGKFKFDKDKKLWRFRHGVIIPQRQFPIEANDNQVSITNLAGLRVKRSISKMWAATLRDMEQKEMEFCEGPSFSSSLVFQYRSIVQSRGKSMMDNYIKALGGVCDERNEKFIKDCLLSMEYEINELKSLTEDMYTFTAKQKS